MNILVKETNLFISAWPVGECLVLPLLDPIIIIYLFENVIFFLEQYFLVL